MVLYRMVLYHMVQSRVAFPSLVHEVRKMEVFPLVPSAVVPWVVDPLDDDPYVRRMVVFPSVVEVGMVSVVVRSG